MALEIEVRPKFETPSHLKKGETRPLVAKERVAFILKQLGNPNHPYAEKILSRLLG
ncbi:MAG: hypothetical protein US86_C0009G0006 [Candidatus Daviesbacteria bacterium GW2011_GWA2_38_24]|uniref:Uncharacterized protein n=1 Tax=Candidatus Daviesbacteria bacterium GW2011_GWA2_38_24 TaxID=1618422 RepID=A0A0G0JD99_9BACT|nr:MAG: hypothetical protein US86_C0009G0006 [Candidatus Daviesbacteria bacterium GW2011_GWA2_38_24]KKQ80695.1 MAG: hypothetical protein UT01_C0007G0018 [Candidatus Daviesbacteria bacterium GW2011_GWA1_38_7]